MTIYKALNLREWCWQILCIKKRMRKRTHQHWRRRWRIDKMTRRHYKEMRWNSVDTKTNRTKIARKQKWEEKQLYGRFKRLPSDISHEKTWTWLRKGNFKREIGSLQIATQTNAIRTNHIKARMDKTQQNSRCRLCGDRDERIDHIIIMQQTNTKIV